MRKQIITTTLALFFAGISLVPSTRAAGSCNLQTIKGTYGLHVTGLGFGTPVVGVSLVSFDGYGNVSSTDTVSFGGFVSSGPSTGTYTVNDDCTGTMTTNFTNGFKLHSNLVIVDNGKEIMMIVTDQGEISTGTFKRQ